MGFYRGAVVLLALGADAVSVVEVLARASSLRSGVRCYRADVEEI